MVDKYMYKRSFNGRNAQTREISSWALADIMRELNSGCSVRSRKFFEARAPKRRNGNAKFVLKVPKALNSAADKSWKRERI
jgi:hypothetical protein